MTQRLVPPDDSQNGRTSCREVKGLLKRIGLASAPGSAGAAAGKDHLGAHVKAHISRCEKCGEEYQLALLKQAILGATRSATAAPDESFFAGVTARIARESEGRQPSGQTESSWTAMVWVTARQLVPIMAVLLLMIVGATLMWGGPVSRSNDSAAIRPSDRVLFHDVFEYPQPTPDDALDILVAVDETTNGK